MRTSPSLNYLIHHLYQCRGANAAFCEADIDWDSLDIELLHIGYILLLDALDEADDAYGTKLARFLHTAQQRGIKTSIDVVTEASERFQRIVTPALKYTDYCVINEAAACSLSQPGTTEGMRVHEEALALPFAEIAQGKNRRHAHPFADVDSTLAPFPQCLHPFAVMGKAPEAQCFRDFCI